MVAQQTMFKRTKLDIGQNVATFRVSQRAEKSLARVNACADGFDFLQPVVDADGGDERVRGRDAGVRDIERSELARFFNHLSDAFVCQFSIVT